MCWLNKGDMEVYTIGHSRHTSEAFIASLKRHEIALVIDVRSSPHSRHVPQFNAGHLNAALRAAGIAYRHLPELGGKPRDPALRLADGSPDYARIAASPAFNSAIEIVLQEAGSRRVVLLCAEGDPTHCHRERLIAAVLRTRNVGVCHILP